MKVLIPIQMLPWKYLQEIIDYYMYLYGASGHAKVILDILKDSKDSIEGIFDDNRNITDMLGYPVSAPTKVKGPLIVAIGDNAIREKIAKSLTVEFGRAIHPSVLISDSARIGAGTVVMHGAIIQSCTQVGQHCIVNTGASIDHECKIGDYVHISPHATLCGNVEVGEGTWVGAGSIIIPGLKIGKWCVIGAGSVVSKNIPDRVLAVGNRCKVIKNI